MNKKQLHLINEYVEENIVKFHNNRIKKLEELKFNTILKRKNPYLFRAKNMNTASEIVKSILDAHLSSGEETIFGNWLEGLAIYISSDLLKNGIKSSSNGVDLEIVNDKYHYLVSIKSGPNWGNSSQLKKLETDFINAKRSIKTSGYNKEVICINGCCYGKKQDLSIKSNILEYYKYCGQVFWEFITGEENFYLDIIVPIGYNAKIMNDEFDKLYAKTINKFTKGFLDDLCLPNGDVDWDKIIQLSSSKYETNKII